jgi:riboflavin synthase
MPPKIGIADTTFARYDMAKSAIDELKKNASVLIERYTVPGIKDLAVACKKLLEESSCDMVMALGMVGPSPIDKQSAQVASSGIIQAELLTNRHIIQVFVHEDEVPESQLAQLADRRTREHALNVLKMLAKKLEAEAGKGKREGFPDVGPLKEG